MAGQRSGALDLDGDVTGGKILVAVDRGSGLQILAGDGCLLLAVHIIYNGVVGGIGAKNGQHGEAGVVFLAALNLVGLVEFSDEEVVGNVDLLQAYDVVEAHLIDAEGNVVVAGLVEGENLVLVLTAGGDVLGGDFHLLRPVLAVGGDVDRQSMVGRGRIGVVGDVECQRLTGLGVELGRDELVVLADVRGGRLRLQIEIVAAVRIAVVFVYAGLGDGAFRIDKV